MRRHNAPGGVAAAVGVLLLIGLAILIVKWLLITAVILAVPFGAWWLWDYRSRRAKRLSAQHAEQQVHARRREIESWAVVDAAGGCGWCGSRIAHRDSSGTIVMPLDHHWADVVHTIVSGQNSPLPKTPGSGLH